MPQRNTKLIAALAGVLWTISVWMTYVAFTASREGLGAAAVLVGLGAFIPTGYLMVTSIVERSRSILLATLLDALERTEQDVVRSISRN